MKIFIFVMFLSFAAWSRLTDDKISIKVELKKITLTPKKGFHLNKDAPANATFDGLETSYKPTLKSEKIFIFSKENKALSATLNYYVCDDKKTVCEQHQKTLNFKTGQINQVEAKLGTRESKEIKLTFANKKPTLLVFSAPWCPACIRMQTETYVNSEVKNKLKKINFLKLNSDLAENFEVSEKFKIKAIPTLILLDNNGMETYRWLDFQPADAFAKELENQLKKVGKAQEILKNAEFGDANAASTLAHKAFNTLDFTEALKWFSQTKSKKDQKYKLASEVLLAQENAEANEKLSEEYAQALQKAISLTPSKLDQLRWTIDFIEKKKDLKQMNDELILKAKKLFVDIDRLTQNNTLAAREFQESTYGNYVGFETEELLWMKGRLYTILELKAEKSKIDRETIASLNVKSLSASRPGEILMAIAYLREAGDIQKVTNLYEQLIKKYPKTYVYYEKYARFVQKNKNYEKALNLTKEALSYPEGNEPQLNLLKSQILKDLNQKTEAVAVINQILKADYIGHKRFTKTVKRLNELRDEITKALSQ